MRYLILISFLFFSCSPLQKYESTVEKWEDEVKKLEDLNKKETYSNQAILFIGSSSIMRWNSIKEDLSHFEPIKRGYGGAIYSDLINFWTKLLPDQIFNANYEEIVKNQEKQSKDILKFCGLEWEDQCLTFHKNKNPIKTMSTAQARKPIYKSSINSYEKFSSFLVSLNKII